MSSGVPQGFVLGLVLILVHSADISGVQQQSGASSFGDKTRLFKTIKDVFYCELLQVGLEVIYLSGQ